MSKKRIILILIALVIAGLTVHSFSAYSEKLTPSTNLTGESVGGVKLHESIDNEKLIQQYGDPLSQSDNALYDYCHWKDGLVTASNHSGTDKGSIERLMITATDTNRSGNPLRTAKGIGLGDTRDQVLALYGKDYYKSNEQNADIIGYIDHEQGITLEFWCLQDGTVAEIRLDDASVK